MQVAGILYSFKAEWGMVAAAASSIGGLLRGMAGGARSIGLSFATMGTSMQLGTQQLMLGAQNASAALLKLGALAVVVGAGIAVALGVLAVHAAADFQQGMTRLVTGAGDVTDNMTKMGASILGISVGTGILTNQLLPAMYQIISAGQRGAQAENTLKVAAQGAIIEQANVVDVTKALTTAMTDYGTKQYNATQFMNGYIKAVSLGKISLQDLSTSMSPILPIAAQLGIKFSDVSAAMSVMTNAGIPADRAATSLRFVMQSLENPTKKATDVMKAMGLNSVDVGNEMKKSLPQALEMIYKAALKAGPEGSVPFNRAMIDMIGGQRSLTAALALTGTHFKTFASDASQIAAAMNSGKNTVNGYKEAQANLNNVMGRVHAAFQAFLIVVGTALIPVIARLMAQIAPLISSFTQWLVSSGALKNSLSFVETALTSLITGITKVVAIGQGMVKFFQQNEVAGALLEATLLTLAAIIGVVLVVALIAYTVAATSAAIANIALFWPVYLAILIIIVVVALVILAIQHWGEIAHWIQGVWAAVINWLLDRWNNLVSAAKDVWGRTGQAINTATTAVINWIHNLWNTVITWIVGQWNTLVNAAKDVWGRTGAAIQGAVNSIISWVKNAWKTTVDAIVGFFQWLYNHNYYWKNMVDAIRNVVSAGVDWLKNAWKVTVSFIQDRWNDLSHSATTVFTDINTTINSKQKQSDAALSQGWAKTVSFVKDRWNDLSHSATVVFQQVNDTINTKQKQSDNAIRAGWTATVAWLQGQWNLMVVQVQAAWSRITAAISSGTANALTPIRNFDQNFRQIFSNLAAGAVQLGRNLIQGLINGINSMLGALGGAAANAAATIAHFLGFHSPTKEGPGKELDTWGPGMMHGFAQGIIKGMPEVQRAVAGVMNPIATLMRTPIQVNASGSIGTRHSTTSNSPATYIIQINGKDLAKALGPGLAQDMRLTIGGR